MLPVASSFGAQYDEVEEGRRYTILDLTTAEVA